MSKELTPTEKKIVDCFTRTQIICKLFDVACAAEGGFSIAATLVSANEMLNVVRDQKACILEWLKDNKPEMYEQAKSEFAAKGIDIDKV